MSAPLVKVCTRCRVERPIRDFHKDSHTREGFTSQCRFCRDATYRKWKENNPEKMKQTVATWEMKHRKQRREWRKGYREKIRLEVLTRYSGGTPRCFCCGETILDFLTIDHIDGGGSQQRKNTGKVTYAFYLDLRKQSFPKGFRVLCFNCNMSLGLYGYCPHQEEMMP